MGIVWFNWEKVNMMMNIWVWGGGLYECCVCFVICSYNVKFDFWYIDLVFKEGDEVD